MSWLSEPHDKFGSFSWETSPGCKNTRYWICLHLAYTVNPHFGIVVNVYGLFPLSSKHHHSNIYHAGAVAGL